METATNSDDADSTLRRPMNAFLLFCKRHRSIVKGGHPWLDNRSCTKMLADMWAVLDWDEKSKYLQLARECKTSFMKAHPDYKWCGSNKNNSKGSTPTMRTRTKSSPCGKRTKKAGNGVWAPDHWPKMKSPATPCKISAGKLADPCDMGGLSLLLLAGEQSMTKSAPTSCSSSELQLSPKSRLFEFAEMCSDQLDHEKNQIFHGKSDTSLEEGEAPRLCTDHNANITVEDKTVVQDLNNCPDHPSDTSKGGCCFSDHAETEGFGRGTGRDAGHTDDELIRCLKTEDADGVSQDISSSSKQDAGESPAGVTDIGAAGSPSPVTGQESGRLDSGRHCSGDEGDGEDDGDDVTAGPRSWCDAEDGWSGDRGIRRKSSRSCKGRLYREYVMEGMLESLQRPERPFNCKKSWAHLEGSSLSDGDDVVFELSHDKSRRVSRRSVRKRTVSGCGSLPSPSDFDYGEIDVEARLATLPQYSPDQFRPKGKCHRQKKSICLYKNSTFVKKNGKGPIKKEHPVQTYSTDRLQVAGSRKRKAPKSSIQHLTLSPDETTPVSPPGTLSNTRQFVLNNHPGTAESVEPNATSSSSNLKMLQSQASEEDETDLADLEAKAFTHPLMSDNSQHVGKSTHGMSLPSALHRSALTVS